MAQSKRDREFHLRLIAAGGHDGASEDCAVGQCQINLRSDGVFVACGAGEMDSEPVVAGVLVVAKQTGMAAGGEQSEIKVAIAVDVGH